ncbi:MAG: TetR/AcrR family transcriptional regulator [Oscillospiraceae bacterium]|nr:TetR/AcrR family transcriptional regulator [Oscillospiraceae bacterium]
MNTTKEIILDAALDLFAENGYTETTIRQIAEIAGIKAASLYNHFPAKIDILLSLIAEYKQNILDTVLSPEEVDKLITELTAIEILRRLFFKFKESNQNRMVKILKIIYHEQYRVEEARSYVRDIQFTFMINHIERVLEKLILAKKVRGLDTKLYASLFVYVVTDTAYRSMLYGQEEYQGVERVTSADILEELFRQIVLD